MTNKPRPSARRHVVRFESQLSEEDKDAIGRMLLDGGAEEVEFEHDSCSVRYPFPEMSLDAIFDLLSSFPCPPPKKRFLDSIVIFMENNERSHVISSGGWKHNLEDVYVYYFNRYAMEREDIRRQTWRKYKT